MWTDREPATDAEVDRLLRKIEDENLIGADLWARMTDTLAYLNDVAGEDAPLVAVGFLYDVIRRGPAVFPIRGRQTSMLEGDARPPQVECPHGHLIDGEVGRDYGTSYVHGRCPEHKIAVAGFPQKVDTPPL